MEITRHSNINLDLTCFTKNELAWVMRTRLDTQIVYATDETLITPERKSSLMQLTKRDLPAVYSAYLSASATLRQKSPLSAEPLADMCVNKSQILVDDKGISVTGDEKTTLVKVVDGVIDWDGNLGKRSIALAKEVMHDVCVVNNKPIVLETATTGIFSPANNAPQAAASKYVVSTMISQNLLKPGSWSGYDLGNAVYAAAERSHLGLVMDVYSDIIREDPPAIRAKAEYEIVQGYKSKMPCPGKPNSNWDFQRPPLVRTTTAGKMTEISFTDIMVQSMAQSYGTALGGDKFRKSSVSTFVTRVPYGQAHFNEITILKDVMSLNLAEDQLLVLGVKNPNVASFVSHNLGIPVACGGAVMTEEERQEAYIESRVITYKELITLKKVLYNGKPVRLVVYHPDVPQLSSGKTFKTTMVQTNKAMSTLVSDDDDVNVVHVYNVTVTALGEKCLSFAQDSVLLTRNKVKVPYYASLAYNMSTMNCLVSSSKGVFKRSYPIGIVTRVVCYFMMNLMYFRYHRTPWHTVLKEIVKDNVQLDVADNSWATLYYSPVPKEKVIWGYDVAFRTSAVESMITLEEAELLRGQIDKQATGKGGAKEKEKGQNKKPPSSTSLLGDIEPEEEDEEDDNHQSSKEENFDIGGDPNADFTG